MKAFFVVCVVLSAVSQCKAEDWPCPAEWSSDGPCHCTYDSGTFELFADCSNAKTDAELEAAFSVNMPLSSFTRLDILQDECTDCAITHFTSSTFGNVASFVNIQIHGTQLNIIDDGAFSNSHEYLRTLSLARNNIDYFPFDSMGQYSQLRTINLNANNFSPSYAIVNLMSDSLTTLLMANEERLNFTAGLVKECPSLVKVQLSNVGLTAMKEFDEEPIGMFTGLQNIGHVDLSGNSITYLRTGTILSESSSLTEVNLSNNLINTVEASFVQGFKPDGENMLNLANNKIDVLDEAVWRDVFLDVKGNGAGIIDLQGNPLLCSCDIAWIVRNADLLNTITEDTMCQDGNTSIYDIPPGWFDVNC